VCLAPWCNWLTRGPFKAESPGSSPGGATKISMKYEARQAPELVLRRFRQFERESQLARTRKSGAADVVFEGVVIPKGTRSAKLANKGIRTEDEMGKFLTSVFADTLNGKILLPNADAGIGVPSRILNGVEEKLRQGLPIDIQATGGLKSSRRSKVKKP
jgi:hypothetical protein